MTIKIIKTTIKELPDGRMDTENAARYVGLSPKTMANQRALGLGPQYIKGGYSRTGRVWYLRKDLDAYLRTNVVETVQSRKAGKGAAASPPPIEQAGTDTGANSPALATNSANALDKP